MRVYCKDQEATEQLAVKLAKVMPNNMVVYLYGNLGAGKTTFARAFIQALGFDGPVKSPTYTLLEVYQYDIGRLAVHMDLYRIAEPEEVDYLALDSYEKNTSVTLIEWPEKGLGYIPLPDIKLHFCLLDAGRFIDIEAQNKQAKKWLANLNS